MPISELESSILDVRVRNYSPMLLDGLFQAGEFVWQGDQALGGHDGYISIYTRRQFPLLGRIGVFARGAREGQIRNLLLAEQNLAFTDIVARLGGFPDDILQSLWKLVWSGEVGSDSLDALRARRTATAGRFQRRPRPRYATRERILPGAAGRWNLLSGPASGFAAQSEREAARAARLLDRYGVLCRHTIAGFDELLPVLEELEARGEALRTRLLRSGGETFAASGAEQVWRDARGAHAPVVLSACDPANPFGGLLAWPEMSRAYRPRRVPGARVFIHDERLVGYMISTGRGIFTPVDLTDPAPLMSLLRQASARGPVFLEWINGAPPYQTPWHDALVDAGFSPSSRGYLLRGGG